MDAAISTPSVPRDAALATAADLIVRQAQRAGAGARVAIAISSRAKGEDIDEVLGLAVRRLPALPPRLHLFAADLCLDTGGRCGESLAGIGAGRGVPARNVHIPAVGGDVLRTARAYETQINAFFALVPGTSPRFDAVCLAPADLHSPRGEALSGRLAVGAYDASTGRCSVWLTWDCLAASPALVSIGAEDRSCSAKRAAAVQRPPVQRLHWIAVPVAASNPSREPSP